MLKPVAKVLVRGVNWLGDAIMTTPALQRLREAHPEWHITLLTPEKLADLWQGQPFLDRVLTFSKADTAWKVGRRLHREQFTAAVAFPNSFRSALELFLARIPTRVGVARGGRNFLLNTVLAPRPEAVRMRKRSAAEVRVLTARPAASGPAISPAAHHVHDYLHLTAALDASREPVPPRIFITDAETKQISEQLGLTDARPWFGLNPGAEYGPAKRWPAERFAETAQALQKEMNCRWAIFGGAADVATAEAIAARLPGALNLAGKTTLRQLTAALKTCRIVITNDTGPMHLASAVGTPVVVPFGSTSPELTGPIFSPSAQVVRNPPPCAPCFRRECPIDLRCLNGIDTRLVIDAARRALAGR